MTNLIGLRVLNTRPVAQAKILSLELKAAGAMVFECPALEIKPLHRSWVNNLPKLEQVTKAIFISANAVKYCFEGFEQFKKNLPTTIQIIAIGEATAAALKYYGHLAALIPSKADSENLLNFNALKSVQLENILLFKGEGGRTLIAETLSARGAIVHSIEVYRRLLPNCDPKEFACLWRNESVDIILFTSQQAMSNLFKLFGEEAHAWLCRTPCLVISERLAIEASLLGIKTIIVSHPKKILIRLHQFNQGLIHGQYE
ncbi:MAG: uroporphyrinogen-III synthase [Tatlockia sp.]|nr:uroporphyrinogen-III synthase [Tatlockia sp.]